MRNLTLLFACLLLAPFGCGSPPNVGATCTATGGCDDGLVCSTSIPGGYCTKPCTTTGETRECPDGSVCDTVSGGPPTCVKICMTLADCRPDLDCNGVSGSNIKACKPKL